MATTSQQMRRRQAVQPAVSVGVAGKRPVLSRHQVWARLRTSGVFWYLLLAFGLPWSLWIPLCLLDTSSSSLIYQVGVLDASFAPAVVAIIVRHWITHDRG